MVESIPRTPKQRKNSSTPSRAICQRKISFLSRKQMTYRRPFPEARYCVQSGRTSIGRPPHSMHLRRQRSAGISTVSSQSDASTIDSRRNLQVTSIDVMPNARILLRVIAGPCESRMASL